LGSGELEGARACVRLQAAVKAAARNNDYYYVLN
jgi:hypothetical protein